MSARCIAVCDLVCDAINAAEVLPPGVVAVRRLWAEFAPEDVQAMQVIVVPGDRAIDLESRSTAGEELTVQVGFRVRAANDAACEEALETVERVIDALVPVSLAGFAFVSAENPAPYDPSIVRERKLLATVVKVTYRSNA